MALTGGGAQTPAPAPTLDVSNLYDQTLRQAIAELTDGTLAFNVAHSMQVNVPERVEARIAKSVTQGVIRGLEGHGISQTVAIKVAGRMTVELTGQAFSIERILPETQVVTSDQVGDWLWNVTPLRSGKQELTLAVTANVDREGDVAQIKVFDQQIDVAVNIVDTGENFIGGNWQWLLGAAGSGGLGLVAWWRRRRQNQSHAEPIGEVRGKPVAETPTRRREALRAGVRQNHAKDRGRRSDPSSKHHR